MPTYAILGATGQVGRSIYANLARDPNIQIHLFVRSEKRLASIIPEASANANVKVFVGDISDIDTLTSCISPPVSIVFNCIAVPQNVPNTTVALDSAHAVVATLMRLRLQSPAAPLPKILILSSATINPHLTRHVNRIPLLFLHLADSYIYADLERAEAYYKLHRTWCTVIFVQPGGLTHDEQRGHAVSLDREKTFLSFLDLGAGMLDIARDAENGEKYDWKGVSVIPTSNDVKMSMDGPLTLLKGFMWHFFPWIYWGCNWLGIV